MSEARAFWIERPGRGAIQPVTLPAPGAGEVLVRALASGISRGTESTVFGGRVPPSQHAAMRCPFQEGEFPGPVKYGYCSVGVVEAGEPDLIGRRVFCLHPHQDRYVVPRSAVHALPDGVPVERAVLAANLETAVNGLWDGAPRIGDRIAVVGGGTVGGMAALLAARLPGTEVELVDVSPSRRRLAERIGTRFASPPDATGDADLVIHASGAAEGLATAMRLAGFEARVVELSWYGDRRRRAAARAKRSTPGGSSFARPRWGRWRRRGASAGAMPAASAWRCDCSPTPCSTPSSPAKAGLPTCRPRWPGSRATAARRFAT